MPIALAELRRRDECHAHRLQPAIEIDPLFVVAAFRATRRRGVRKGGGENDPCRREVLAEAYTRLGQTAKAKGLMR